METEKGFVKVGVKSHGVDVQRGTKTRQQRESSLNAVERLSICQILQKQQRLQRTFITWRNCTTLCLKKRPTFTTCYNFYIHIFPPHLTSASALPAETGNPEIASFHLNVACVSAKKHETQLKISPGQSWTTLHCQNDRVGAPDRT